MIKLLLLLLQLLPLPQPLILLLPLLPVLVQHWAFLSDSGDFGLRTSDAGSWVGSVVVVVVVVAVEKVVDFERLWTKKNWQELHAHMMQPMRLPLLDISLATGNFIQPPNGEGQLWEVVFCLMISPYLNRFADDHQKLNEFKGVNKRLIWEEQNCSKAENSLQFQELPYIRNMTTRATFCFCGKVWQWQPARHVVWSHAEIANSHRKESSWGCMSDNANQ